MRMKDKKSAFTLVELLVVLMVIGVLAGIIFSGATFLFGEQGIKQAKTELEILQLCLDEYRRDIGSYPITEDLGDSKECGVRFLQALHGTHDEEGNFLGEDFNRKMYLPLDKFETDVSEESEDSFLVDPWGEPYEYNFPRLDGHEGYLLLSKGPDGEFEPITEQIDGIPEKTTVDFDNIPSSEPGKW